MLVISVHCVNEPVPSVTVASTNAGVKLAAVKPSPVILNVSVAWLVYLVVPTTPV